MISFPFPMLLFSWSTLSVFESYYSPMRTSPSLILLKRPFSQVGANSMAHNCGDFYYILRWMNYYPVLPVIPPPR